MQELGVQRQRKLRASEGERTAGGQDDDDKFFTLLGSELTAMGGKVGGKGLRRFPARAFTSLFGETAVANAGQDNVDERRVLLGHETTAHPVYGVIKGPRRFPD